MAKGRVKVRVRVRVKFKVAKYLSFDIMSRSQYTYVFSLFRKITLAMTLKTSPSRISTSDLEISDNEHNLLSPALPTELSGVIVSLRAHVLVAFTMLCTKLQAIIFWYA